jgi:hypothetical protein
LSGSETSAFVVIDEELDFEFCAFVVEIKQTKRVKIKIFFIKSVFYVLKIQNLRTDETK